MLDRKAALALRDRYKLFGFQGGWEVLISTRMVESDPQKMVALLLGIPGARLIELRGTDDTLDLLIETDNRPVACPECGSSVESLGHVLDDLIASSVGGQVTRVTWRRRRWRCVAPDCSVETFFEEDSGVIEFNERVSAANRRFPLRDVLSAPSRLA